MLSMKKFQLLFVIGISLFGKAICQNWSIIEPNVYYNYSTDSIIQTTIRVDSVFQTDQDIVYVLNRVCSVCKECKNTVSASAIYLRHQPSILQSFIIRKPNGDYYLKDTGDYYIRRNIKPDSTWLFDSKNLKYATYLKNGYVPVFDNVFDSVKYFIIDNTDTLILSKNYGIIKMPDFKGKHFNLTGVEGKLNEGRRNLYFRDFFTLNAGDILQYSLNSGGRFPYYEEIQKHTVRSVDVTGDSIITINTMMLSRQIIYDYYMPKDTIYKNSPEKLTYRKSELSFLDNFNLQDITDINPTRVGFDPIFRCTTKYLSDIGIFLIGDTVYSTYNPYYRDDLLDQKFGNGIGLLSYNHTWSHSGPFHGYNTQVLRGYFNGQVTYGTIFDDSYLSVKPPDELKVSVFPTGFTYEFEIQFGDRVNEVVIRLIDMAGRVRYSVEEHGIKNTIIQPVGLDKGVYILKIDIPYRLQVVKKLVKM